MAKPLRLEFAGALYHVTACGDGREEIGAYFGRHHSRISKIVRAPSGRGNPDQAPVKT